MTLTVGLFVSLAAAQEKKPAPAPQKAQPAQQPQQKGQDSHAGHSHGEGQAGQMDPKMMEAMQKCMEYGTPGEGHEQLNPLIGKWTYTMKAWMDPAGEPMSWNGTAEFKWVLDGHYIQQDVTAPPQEPDPRPFSGTGIIGYDNMLKRYRSIWFDNMSTGIMVLDGTWDPAKKTLTSEGEHPDPMTGNVKQKVKTVCTMNGNDSHTFAMFSPGPDGKEFKCMEIVYTRAK
jgi:hypothetical protein